eukprot:CAMPEP_0181118156 /NCGR_PEP_ID=MMETSP1071-20121207/22918_1 /TAXON_ID=35127 /ORGANISM="Thalassiosira sp., Strain NH16" /LENGTH=239 /DNA_ID=CAMNT_0023202617 /DNA_START=887 /DNA_END=1603 /DNA_ORIENTATION=+
MEELNCDVLRTDTSYFLFRDRDDLDRCPPRARASSVNDFCRGRAQFPRPAVDRSSPQRCSGCGRRTRPLHCNTVPRLTDGPTSRAALRYRGFPAIVALRRGKPAALQIASLAMARASLSGMAAASAARTRIFGRWPRRALVHRTVGATAELTTGSRDELGVAITETPFLGHIIRPPALAARLVGILVGIVETVQVIVHFVTHRVRPRHDPMVGHPRAAVGVNAAIYGASPAFDLFISRS